MVIDPKTDISFDMIAEIKVCVHAAMMMVVVIANHGIMTFRCISKYDSYVMGRSMNGKQHCC